MRLVGEVETPRSASKDPLASRLWPDADAGPPRKLRHMSIVAPHPQAAAPTSANKLVGVRDRAAVTRPSAPSVAVTPADAPRVTGMDGSNMPAAAATAQGANSAGSRGSIQPHTMPMSALTGDASAPSGCSRVAMPMLRPCSHAADSVAAVATWGCGAAARASGMSSAHTIHTMHPAANPRARGSSAVKVSTNMKEGTATSA
mmetsp:Transcript_2386/g.6015  ORF Transcript_2386/g.6015 Transcript_2386/m.6015 type:complete len:202 (+) Transcript_2386:309-914(+)